MDDVQIRTAKTSADYAKEIQFILRDLQIKNKLQLLEYEWTVLPVENLKVFIITDRNQVEFTYNG